VRKVKCAVVGAGLFGRIHCDTYHQDAGAEFVTVCDLNEERASSAAKEYNIGYTLDYRDIAADPDIELVSVTTPDFAHRDITINLLQAGKHVLVEKPMATTVADAEAMAKAAKETGKMLMVDFHNRFNPPFVDARKRLEAGELGKIMMVYSKLSDRISVPLKWFKWSAESGPHWFLFPHTVDVICWLMSAYPKKVYARGTKEVLKSKGVDTYDVITALLDFGGAYATVETSWIIPDNWPQLVEFAFDLQGSKGKLHFDVGPSNFMIASDEKDYCESPILNVHMQIHGRNFGFAYLPIRHFIECVRESRQPMISPREGVENVRIICAILESLEEDRVVEL